MSGVAGHGRGWGLRPPGPNQRAMSSVGFPHYFSLHLYSTAVEVHPAGYKCSSRKKKANLRMTQLLGGVTMWLQRGCGVVQERQLSDQIYH